MEIEFACVHFSVFYVQPVAKISAEVGNYYKL